MERQDLGKEIRSLCRRLISANDPDLIEGLFERLRFLLHEQKILMNDIASEALATVLEQEKRSKKVS
jgi:hypothetical protein